MGEAWSCYLIAFKNIFDYKNTAERKELNWFIAFMTAFWMLAIMLFFFLFTMFAIMRKEVAILVLFIVFFIFAAIYMIAHWIPYIALIKRRFNLITPNKSGLFFGIWLGLWLISILISIISVYLLVHYKNPLIALPLMLINHICSLIFIGIIIFLMVKKEPIL